MTEMKYLKEPQSKRESANPLTIVCTSVTLISYLHGTHVEVMTLNSISVVYTYPQICTKRGGAGPTGGDAVISAQIWRDTFRGGVTKPHVWKQETRNGHMNDEALF